MTHRERGRTKRKRTRTDENNALPEEQDITERDEGTQRKPTKRKEGDPSLPTGVCAEHKEEEEEEEEEEGQGL